MHFKISHFLFVLILCILLTNNSSYAKSTKVTLVINDYILNESSVLPLPKEGITYVHIGEIAKGMDAKVEWYNYCHCAVISQNGLALYIYTQNKIAYDQHGNAIPMLTHIWNQRLYVPYRSLVEHFKYIVDYVPSIPMARATNKEAKLTSEQIENAVGPKMPAKDRTLPYKKVYITFDDGPTKSTQSILNTLEKYGAKATFFMLSNTIKTHKSIALQMVEKGYGIACHGTTHDKSKFYYSDISAVNEMNVCLNTVKNITGVNSVLVRTPYGSEPYLTQKQYQYMKQQGYKLWDWNIDSLDWKLKDDMKIKNHVVQQLQKLEKKKTAPVILFHDLDYTSKALPSIIQYLQLNGYTLEIITNGMKEQNFFRD